MSKETMTWLNTNTLIGYRNERGNAWHYRADLQVGDGNHFDGPVPLDRALELLNRVQPIAVPLEATLPELLTVEGVTPARHITDPTRQVILDQTTGAVFAVFSDGYVIHQYEEWLVRTIENLLDDDLGIGSVGLLDNGAIAWVQVEVPESIVTPEGVQFRPHLLGMTSHNGKRATGFARTVTNVVCDNTMAIAASEKGQKIKYKHTKYSGVKIADARDALAIVHTAADDFAAEVAELTAQHVDDVQWQKFLDEYVPLDPAGSKRAQTMTENKRGELNRLYKYDERVAPWKGTAWGVMQAVNTYDQHYAIARNLGDGNKGEARFGRSLMAATDGSLDKQAATVKGVLAAVAG